MGDSKTDNQVILKISLSKQVNFACHQNAIPLIRDISIQNNTEFDLENLTLRMNVSPNFVTSKTWNISDLPAESEINITDRDTSLNGKFLLDLTEAMSGDIEFILYEDDVELVRKSEKIEVLARNEWGGYGGQTDLVAAFSMPNDPAVDKILFQSLDVLKRGSKSDVLDGYASGKRTRAWEVSAAIWSSLASLKLKYSYPPKSFESIGQKIRIPSMVMSSRIATCMDTTMLFCSALEQAGLNPIVVLKKGHAFVGVWLQPESFRSVVTDDVVELRKRIAADELIVFETTLITQDPPLSFTSAIEHAKKQLDEDHESDFVCVIDIHRARDQKIKPLSFVESSKGDELDEGDAGTAISQALEEAPALEDFSCVSNESDVQKAEETRLERWQRKLLDLSLRNPLLNSKNSQTAIPIACKDPGLLEDVLADGKSISILPFPDLSEGRDAEIYNSRTGKDLESETIEAALKKYEVYVKDDPKKLESRLVSLYRKAKSDLEEGGANTLFLSIGFLSWVRDDKQGRKFRAPLILVPVELKRKSVRSGVKLVLHDDEPRFNTTLLEMLRQDTGLDIQGLDGELPTDASGVDVAGIWKKIRHEIKDIDGFEVVEDVVLSTFSFAKYLMWKDLVDRTEKLKENPVVRHLMDTPRDPYSTDLKFFEPRELDDSYKPSQLFTPLPADSSQISSVVSAGQGKDFVIIGPPGSGKSQTIANMIAHLMGLGKTVLFVSEKSAALNVVYRRLKEVGLADFCLELHSNKAKKLDVINQFRFAWGAAETMSQKEWDDEAQKLESLRDSLNEYVRSLHKIHHNGLTIHTAIGVVSKNKDLPEIEISYPKVNMHTEEELKELKALVHDLRVSASRFENIANHPLRSIAHTDWTNAWQHKVVSIAQDLSLEARSLINCTEDFASKVHLSSEGFTLEQVGALKDLAECLLNAYGVSLDFAFEANAQEILRDADEAASLLLKYKEKLLELSVEYKDLAWKNISLDELQNKWDLAQESWFVKSFLQLRSIKKELLIHAKSTSKIEINLESDLKILSELRSIGTEIEMFDGKLSSLSQWASFDTDVDSLKSVLRFAKRMRSSLTSITDDTDQSISLKSQIKKIVCDGNELLAPEAALGRSLASLISSFDNYKDLVADFRKRSSKDLGEIVAPESSSLQNVISVCDDILENKNRLNEWCSWCSIRFKGIDAGLSPLIEALETGVITVDRLEDAFDAAYCRWWVERKWDSDKVLRSFNSQLHQDKIEQFKAQDDKLRDLTGKYIRARVCGEIPKKDSVTAGSEYGMLRRILEQKRPRKSLRRLISDMPTALTQLTPCVLMSPLSISQYLPTEQKSFDVVIFDEASQITVWDAIGSIARAHQTIVAGDPKQLPPTSFFGRADDEDEDADNGDLESILDEMLGAGIPTRDLKWHYRSDNESLITFSNHNYYGGNLITFPSPVLEDDAVKFVKVNGVYQKGGGRTNRQEADAVVAEIVKRLKDKAFNESKKTIGVVTFNSEQQRLIENLLDEERRRYPEIEPHFSEDVLEPVFVKNLESVQGDERDVILFSTTYGPDLTGKLSMNFGPLNRDGGERRLNVAITRARSEMVVFSSLSADDIDLSRTSAVGVRDLKHFLDFANRGVKALGEAIYGSQGDFDSPFEVAVARGLQERGWTIHPQIGVSAFRVDLGVVHPDFPGKYLVGVECDGATYHRSATARDRDKAREGILSRLGWKLLRLWSTDFWVDAEGELDKLDAAIRELLELDRHERALEEESQKEQNPPVIEAEAVVEECELDIDRSDSEALIDARVVSDELNREQYKIYTHEDGNHSLDPERFYDEEYSSTLKGLIKGIVDMEAPLRIDVLSRRVARVHDFKKAGSRIAETVEKITKANFDTTLEGDHEYVWPTDIDPHEWSSARVPVKEESLRSVDEISHVELKAFARKHREAIDPVEAIKRDLGFSRLKGPAKEKILHAIRSIEE